MLGYDAGYHPPNIGGKSSPASTMKNSPSPDAVLWGLAKFDTFKDGMLAVVNLGGDSDSIGAVYGQLAGCFYGFNSIPTEWIHDVKDWQFIDELIDTFLMHC